MITSPEVSTHLHEIWILGPGDREELFESGRLFESHREAYLMCLDISCWFHQGEWNDAAFDRLPESGQEELFALRQGFKAMGADPRFLGVEARAVETDWTPYGEATVVHDPDATSLEPVDVMYFAADAEVR